MSKNRGIIISSSRGKKNSTFGRSGIIIATKLKSGQIKKSFVAQNSTQYKKMVNDRVMSIGDKHFSDTDTVWRGLFNTINTAATKAAFLSFVKAQEEIMAYADEQFKSLFESRQRGVLTGNTKTSIQSVARAGRYFESIMGLPSVKGRRATRGKLTTKDANGRKRFIKVKSFKTGKYVYFPKDRIIETSGGDAYIEAFRYLKNHGFGRDIGSKKLLAGFALVAGDPDEPKYVEGLDVYFNIIWNHAKNLLTERFSNALKQEIKENRG